MNSVERFELKALAFYRMTGHLAPGKDRPAAAGPYDEAAIAAEWGAWNDQYGAAFAAFIAAHDERHADEGGELAELRAFQAAMHSGDVSIVGLQKEAKELRAKLAEAERRAGKLDTLATLQARDLFVLNCKVESLTRDLAAAREQVAGMRGACEAAGVFVTPQERLRHWDDYKEDAARRLSAALAAPPAWVAGPPGEKPTQENQA